MTQKSRPGRVVLFEREVPPGARILSVPMDARLASEQAFPEALALLSYAQRYASAEFATGKEEVDLELLATVQHGGVIPIAYTLHFEVTRRG